MENTPAKRHLPLPIDPFLPEIAKSLECAGAVVVTAEPGAGKTTRVPPFVLESGILDAVTLPGTAEKVPCGAAILEPRRLAARLTAARVASEMGCSLGETAGYQVRFDERVSERTRLTFMTEGILLRRLAEDPNLLGFRRKSAGRAGHLPIGAVILDEVHERHLETDTALALCERLRRTCRPDLKIAVMSATMNAEAFSAYLGGAPIVRVPGRTFQVSVEHARLIDTRPLEDQAAGALRKALGDDDDGGDILVFLPGAGEIRRTAQKCMSIAEAHGLELCVLHGELPPEEQDRALKDTGRRKLILATNIAESSLTLPGVTCVIDSGLERTMKSDPFTGIPSLQLARISKSSAIQRAGRAGRVRSGRCIRLYDRHDFDTRSGTAIPEILRLDLSGTCLLLHGMGIRDVSSLAWLDPPPDKSLQAAESLLTALGAVTSGNPGVLTETGRRMLALPVHPRLARMMAESERRGFGTSGALLAALLSERGIRERSADDMLSEQSERRQTALCSSQAPAASDVLEDLFAFEAASRERFSAPMMRSFDLSNSAVRRVDRSFQKLRHLASKDVPGKGAEWEKKRGEALLFALLASHPDRVAMRRIFAEASRAGAPFVRPEFLLCGGGSARLGQMSRVLDSKFIVAVDIEERGRGAQRELMIRSASEIEPEWLIDLPEGVLSEVREASWNARLGRPEVREKLCFGRLTVSETPSEPTDEEAEGLLTKAALEAGPERFADKEALETLRARVALLVQYFPEMGLVSLTDERIREVLAAHCTGKRTFADLDEMPFVEALADAAFGTSRHLADRLLPAHISLPGGRRLAVHYPLSDPPQPPWAASRLQDFFGTSETPRIADGRISLVIHLLAPSQRPVQVTTDLAGFWAHHYPELMPALSRRYPKHLWPSDPAHASPPAPGAGRRRQT